MAEQLPDSGALVPVCDSASPDWFIYRVKVHPHHTDYGGIAWHGSYLTWMEAARVECLRSLGVEFAELVTLGCDLPVVTLNLRYHRPARLGESLVIKTRMTGVDGVRIPWDYEIVSLETQELCLSGQVILVAVDREKGRILRQLPPVVQAALTRLAQ
ncbi:MAG: acyl-CoA thioesterase [Gloeomargaritaceae cyanobacterium C42_A2020_066]|nr:acyl-CoA thioesterase [Gloeomargaritaceae cyanobacterium C42_A2020_066]